jgi:pyruvate,water dikinase
MTGNDRPYLRWFAELSLDDRDSVGGKGASLGELTRAGIRVPPGFVVLTTANDAFMKTADPDDEIVGMISALDKDDAAAIDRCSETIRNRLRAADIPSDVVDAIRTGYAVIGEENMDRPVAVRSSATCEDSEDASFAGLQDTYLWTIGADDLVDRVRDCWASLYNTESVAYRLRLGIPESQLSMAVVVQEMIDAECAGVMFTRSPTTGDRSVVLIEGSWGLGSCIVNGEVTPDRFVVNKVTGEITTRDVSAKAVEHRPDPNGSGTVEQDVDSERQSVSCLDDERIKALWQTARAVERHYGVPQDIEWAFSRDRAQPLYLLQSRPETVWANRESAPAAKPTARAFDHVLTALSTGKKSP